MSRTNETKNIKWHETCKCECRLDAIVCNDKQRWNNDKCWCELIDKGVRDKGYAWNPSNCECDCDKSCNIGEYLDYENCTCKKRLVDTLVEEYNETIDEEELKPAIIIPVKNNYKHNSCIVYIVLFSIFFIINVGIGAYFAYYKYRNREKKNISRYDYVYQTTYKTYKWRK